jgi:hypothetical protein
MPLYFKRGLFSAVDKVTHNRAAQKRHMQSDLVRTPCQGVRFYQGVLAELLDGVKFRYGCSTPTIRNHRHLFAMSRIPSDSRFHPS